MYEGIWKSVLQWRQMKHTRPLLVYELSVCKRKAAGKWQQLRGFQGEDVQVNGPSECCPLQSSQVDEGFIGETLLAAAARSDAMKEGAPEHFCEKAFQSAEAQRHRRRRRCRSPN